MENQMAGADHLIRSRFTICFKTGIEWSGNLEEIWRFVAAHA